MEEHVIAQPYPSATRASTFADRPSYKWWVTWTIMVGAFLFALDTTIVNIAIPKIMTSISADLNQIQWVLIIYYDRHGSGDAYRWLAERPLRP